MTAVGLGPSEPAGSPFEHLVSFVAKILDNVESWEIEYGRFVAWDDAGDCILSFPITAEEALVVPPSGNRSGTGTVTE